MANIDAGLVRGPQGPQGIKGDPFTYADFTESQIAELQRPATEAATHADKATKDAQAAIAEVKATEEKLYPAAENILKGKVKESFVHVEDAFPSSLLGIEIEGATEQVTTTGKNLVDAYNQDNEKGYLTVDGSLKVDGRDEYHVSNYVPIEPSTTYFVTMSRTTHTSAPAVCEYDSGKAFVAGHSNLAMGAAFTTASNAAFVRVSCKTNEPGVVQLEKGSIQTAYEPYTGGKPSPSPEYPQEIKVIENPVVNMIGRNFAEVTNISTNKDIFSGVLFVEADIKPSENYILSFDVDTAGNEYYLNENLFTYKDFYVKKGRNYVQCRTVDSISKSNPAQYSTTTGLKGWILLKNSKAQTNDVQFSNVQLERGSTVSDYAPYVGTSTPFTLPEEHPYLAKLPDGTADEIIVDKDGNVELVARVGRDDNVRNVKYISIGNYYELSVKLPAFANAASLTSYSALCSAIQSSIKNTDGIYRTWTGVYVKDTSGHTKEEIQAEVDKNAPLTIFAPIPETRYSLGKIEIPKAQYSIVNVWTDAEVTPKTGIEYTRDVNIVVANIESAIASIS